MGPRQAGVPFQLIRVGATHERRKKMKKMNWSPKNPKVFSTLEDVQPRFEGQRKTRVVQKKIWPEFDRNKFWQIFWGKMKKICAPNVEIEWLDTK